MPLGVICGGAARATGGWRKVALNEAVETFVPSEAVILTSEVPLRTDAGSSRKVLFVSVPATLMFATGRSSVSLDENEKVRFDAHVG